MGNLQFNQWISRQPVNIRSNKERDPMKVTLTPYWAEAPTEHDCVLIFPGGGYNHVSIEKEGSKIAKAFNKKRINAFVLDYRTAPCPKVEILADAILAVRLVRDLIRNNDIGSGRLALMGFSAGGHLALTETEHWQETDTDDPSLSQESGKPDALILCYPVVTFRDPYAHKGSRECFLGKDDSADPGLIGMYSGESHISPDFPPVFLWHCEDDKSVPIENSLMLHEALDQMGIDHKLMIYKGGAHGLGLAPDDEMIREWFPTCVNWLREHGFQ